MKNVPKVVVPFDGCSWVHNQRAKELHAHNGVDEEQHSHQHTDVGQRFEALDKSVEQNSHTDRPSQKLD